MGEPLTDMDGHLDPSVGPAWPTRTTAMPTRSTCSVLGDGARQFDNGPQALVTDDQAVIRMLTGPSVMTGAGALMPEAFFPIHSRATLTL